MGHYTPPELEGHAVVSPRAVKLHTAALIATTATCMLVTAGFVFAAHLPRAPRPAAPTRAVAAPIPSVEVELEPPTPPTVRPPTLEQKLAMFRRSREDRSPALLDGMTEAAYGRHYYCSDEWNLHLFRKYVDGLGGGYVGVGTDQAYLFIGWARPEWSWVIDYDREVVELHEVYANLFLEVDRPNELVYLFSPEGRKRAREILRRRNPEPEKADRLVAAYDRARHRVSRRLERLRVRFARLGVKGFVNDQAMYDFVRGSIEAGRVQPLMADLNGSRALRSIGRVAKELDVPIRVLYLSNAEQYWEYEQSFRDNVAALPLDRRSVVLRTQSSWSSNRDYRYNVQAALDFQRRVQDTAVRQVYAFVPWRRVRGPDDIVLTVTEK